MIYMKGQTMWIFVVDTEQYAGNFERQLCAFMTGAIGECGVGAEEVEQFNRDLQIPVGTDFADDDHPFSNVASRPDDHGCYRPCAIWPTPGWSNDGHGNEVRLEDDAVAKFPAYFSVGIFFDPKPSQEQIEIMQARAGKFRKDITITGFRLIRETTSFALEGEWAQPARSAGGRT